MPEYPLSLLHDRRHPRYGPGAMQRRIELRGGEGHVEGSLVDTFHDMSCRVEHDGLRVTGISGSMQRIPTTTCSGAIAVLDELVGLPLVTPTAQLYAGGRARRNCTHLFDLAVLAFLHCARGPLTRRYEARVPDELEAAVEITLSRDGVPVLAWKAFGARIVAPATLAGQPLREGFAQWASRQFSGDEFEAATVLARTYGIARGRAYDIDAWAGHTAGDIGHRTDVCYSYAYERRNQTVFLGGNLRESP